MTIDWMAFDQSFVKVVLYTLKMDQMPHNLDWVGLNSNSIICSLPLSFMYSRINNYSSWLSSMYLQLSYEYLEISEDVFYNSLCSESIC